MYERLERRVKGEWRFWIRTEEVHCKTDNNNNLYLFGLGPFLPCVHDTHQLSSPGISNVFSHDLQKNMVLTPNNRKKHFKFITNLDLV